MGSGEVSGGVDLSNCGFLSEGLQVVESVGFGGSGLDKKYLLKDLDPYLDDLNACVIVSRMVNDSVLKGTVNVGAQEAIEEVSSEEAEMDVLKEMMFLKEFDRTWCNSCGSLTECTSEESTCEEKMELVDQRICDGDSRLTMKEQIQILKNEISRLRNIGTGIHQHSLSENLARMSSSVDVLYLISETACEQNDAHFCPYKELLCEQQLQWDIEKGIHSVMVEHFIKEMREDCQRKLFEEHLYSNKRKNLPSKRMELSSLREELDDILTSILSLEPGSLEIYEERRSSNKKYNASHKVLTHHLLPCTLEIHRNGSITSDIAKKPMVEIVDIAKLAHLSKEELITYFMTEMAKMNRQHEVSLHEKTEELFRMKRQLLRERGSLPFRKDKDFEIVRNRFLEFASKLDNIIAAEDNVRPLSTEDDIDCICNFKDRIDVLLSENQHLKDSLAEKRKEVQSLSSRMSDAENVMSHHTSAEIKFSEQMTKLKQDLEDTKIETVLQDEFLNIILINWTSSIRSKLVNLHTEVTIDRDVHQIVMGESIKHALMCANATQQSYKKEKMFLMTELSKKDEALLSEVTDRGELQSKIESLSKLVEEKENIAQDNMSMLIIQQQKFEVLCQEIKLLGKKNEEEERGVLLKEQEMCILKDKLEDAHNQIHQYEAEIEKISEKLKVAQTDLEDSEKQRIVVENIAQDYMSMSVVQQQKIEVLCQEMNLLWKQNEEEERKVLLKEQEMYILKDRLEDASRQIHQYETEIQKNATELKVAQINLEDSENQKIMLEKVIQDEKTKTLSTIRERELVAYKMKVLVLHSVGLSKSLDDFETKVSERIKIHDSRLKDLKSLLVPVSLNAHNIQSEVLRCRKSLEINSSNLQKAEDEVDLLGDEVEALWSILAKVYITLDHYSHVLQHYPGVMEMLVLVRRELEGSVMPCR